MTYNLENSAFENPLSWYFIWEPLIMIFMWYLYMIWVESLYYFSCILMLWEWKNWRYQYTRSFFSISHNLVSYGLKHFGRSYSHQMSFFVVKYLILNLYAHIVILHKDIFLTLQKSPQLEYVGKMYATLKLIFICWQPWFKWCHVIDNYLWKVS